MNRTPIDPFKMAGAILEPLPAGILLNTCADGKINTMTIGWGWLGMIWNKKTFAILVRDSRYSLKMLEKNGEFTISIPWNNTVDEKTLKHIIGFAGTRSGKDVDKFEALGLQTVEGETVSTPAIVQLPLTLECRALYYQQQDPAQIPEDITERHYPQEDYHMMIIGEITAAYILE